VVMDAPRLPSVDKEKEGQNSLQYFGYSPLGSELAGEIEAVGKDVKLFKLDCGTSPELYAVSDAHFDGLAR
jgi:hypothetical protein